MDEVLIAGAGPTGLTLALWLTRQGVPVRIIDQAAGPGETSRAMVVQARTLELYRQLDLDEAVVANGHKMPAMNIWAQGACRARIALDAAGADVTPYAFVLVYPQDLHERLLVERLALLGVQVERRVELMDVEDEGTHVAVRLRQPDGSDTFCEARWLAACDGARSAVRHRLGVGFEGGTYRHVFYVADVELGGLARPDEGHGAFDHADFVLVLPYGGGRFRLIGTVRDERADRAGSLRFEDVGQDAIASLGLSVRKVHWFSTYHVHHRVADTFRRGRIFLLGDAAHIHSPAGGQGMNTGILDANNLAWKLAAVVHGGAPDSLLDTYALERQAFARKLVATTDRVFTFATSPGGLAEFVRNHVFPTVANLAYKVDDVREFMFRTVSQTTIDYREGPLGAPGAGRNVHGGDRLPWVRADGADNYDSLRRIGWQVHVYGTVRPELRAWCEAHAVPLHGFGWTPAHGKAALARDAAYLLRPDTWVATVDTAGTGAALERYLAAHAINPARGSAP
jgi:2-polyprenyl-6-methoxyphenol hydroxylase-like FAD-dependent oxidoreductase